MKTEQKRLNDIGYKILSANSELCNETTHVAGFSVWNDVSIDKEYRDVVKRRYNLTDALEISEVYEGMPAQRAGLRVGDKILSINGTMVEKGLTIDKYQSRFRKKFTHQNLNIDVLRNNERLSFNLNPQRICNYPVALIDEDIINAFADGSGIYIYRGMSRFTSDDDELALVISHELAHNVMGHVDAKRTNSIGGTVLGAAADIAIGIFTGVDTGGVLTQAGSVAGAIVHSKAFEREADYVGMYYMARAGYDISNVENFWRRMAIEGNSAVMKANLTHPTSPERFVSIEKTKNEIIEKRNNNIALRPNLTKERAVAGQ